MYASMSAILLAMSYSILRPSADKPFQLWWVRGRFGIMLLFLCVVCSVVCAFTLFNNLIASNVLVGFSADVCIEPRFISSIAAMCALLLVVAAAVVTMAL
jgi:hypothetical protein